MANAGSYRRQAELLANLDTHWLERLALPLLAVGFSLSATALACDLLTFMMGPVRPSPWIAVGSAIAAIEGVYGAQLRERANAPQFVRVWEIAFHLTLSYFMLRIGGIAADFPVFSTAALRQPEVYVPLGLVYLSWRLASTAGLRFVWIGSVVQSLGEQVAAKLAWDQESVVSTSGLGDRRASVTRFFAVRTLAYTLAGCILAAGAFDSFPEAAAAQPVWRMKVAAALSCLLLFGLLLQGVVHLYRLRSIWDVTGVDVTAGVYERWLGLTAIAVSAAIVVGIAAPTFAIFDFQAMVHRLSESLSDFFAHGLEIFNKQVRGGRTERLGPWESRPPVGGGPGALVAAIAFRYFLLLSVTLVVFGALLLVFFRNEWRKLPGLFRLPVLSLFWLRSIGVFFVSAFFTLFRWGRRHLLGRPFGWKSSNEGPRPALSRDLEADRKAPAGSVRRYLVRLVDEAARRKIALKPHETAREFTRGLAVTLGGVDEELEFLTARYEDVRYGGRPEGPEDEAPVARAYARVVERLGKVGSGEPPHLEN